MYTTLNLYTTEVMAREYRSDRNREAKANRLLLEARKTLRRLTASR